SVERVAHGVVVTPVEGAAKRVRVLAYGDAAFRVTAVPVTSLDIPESLMVTAKPAGDPAIGEANGIVTLKLPRATAEVRLADGKVRFRDARGNIVLDQSRGAGFASTMVEGKPYWATQIQFNPGT